MKAKASGRGLAAADFVEKGFQSQNFDAIKFTTQMLEYYK